MGNKNHLYLLLVIVGIAVTLFSLWGVVALNSAVPRSTDLAVASESNHEAQNNARPNGGDAALRPASTFSDPQP